MKILSSSGRSGGSLLWSWDHNGLNQLRPIQIAYWAKIMSLSNQGRTSSDINGGRTLNDVIWS